jgi:hypothetical protein
MLYQLSYGHRTKGGAFYPRSLVMSSTCLQKNVMPVPGLGRAC